MTQHYNKRWLKARRRRLRRNQTPAEARVWELLRNRRCLGVKFRRQYSVDHFILDFYAPELKLAVEPEGGIHTTPDQQEYDQHRHDRLKAFGITIVRLSNELILDDPAAAREKIEAIIQDLQAGED